MQVPDVEASPKRPIIAFAHHPWQEPEWMNRQHILSRLAQRGWPVTYSSGVLDWWGRKGEAWRRSPLTNRTVIVDGVRIAEAGRIGAGWQRYLKYDKWAVDRHSRFLRRGTGVGGDTPIVMIFHPKFFPYVSALEPCNVVFHAYDAYSAQYGWSEQLGGWQRALVERADLISASSSGIADAIGVPDARILENGADVAAFGAALSLPEPSDLSGIPHPRVGYSGTINRKVDLPLVAAVAATRPDWQWVFVGRVEEDALYADPALSSAYRACLALRNVHFLGQKNRCEVPAYVAHMDVNVMCYRTGAGGWWNVGSPLKLHEYLATGKPVVSNRLQSILRFEGVIQIASSVAEWESSISQALIPGSRVDVERRIDVARENSWDRRIDTYEQWLSELRS